MVDDDASAPADPILKSIAPSESDPAGVGSDEK